MVKKNILKLIGVCVVLFVGLNLFRCSVVGPEQPQGKGEATGSVAPKLVFKSQKSQAGISFYYYSDTLVVSTIQIRIVAQNGKEVKGTFQYSAHQATLDNIPEGEARIYISAHTQTGDTVVKGDSTVTVIAGQTAAPTVDLWEGVLPTQPVNLEVTQLCNGRVELTWRPTGYPYEYHIKGERYSGGIWSDFQNDTIYVSGDMTYNPITDRFSYIDSSNVPLVPGEIRFSVRAVDTWNYAASPFSGYRNIDLVNMGSCGVPVTNKYDYHGYVYGIVGSLSQYSVRLKVYKAGVGSPSFAALPVDVPVRTWYYNDAIRPSVTFAFDSLEEGNYWIYAYDNLDGQDSWGQAFKRAIYTRTHDKNTYSGVITLDFSGTQFPTGSTLSGTLNGSISSQDYYTELYWYNSSQAQSYFLGFYYCGNGLTGPMAIDNVPSLSDIANYFQFSYNALNDYYYLYIWNDEDMSETFNSGDLYYYNGFLDSWEYYVGNVLAPKNVGNIYLDSVYTGLGKKFVGKKQVSLH